jgi:hypothetical protein
VIHINDLKEIINNLLDKRDIMSEREMNFLLTRLSSKHIPKKSIMYIKLFDIFDSTQNKALPVEKIERWNDEEELETEKWAFARGSLGEWLKRAACPSEIKNFKRLIAHLEDFERSSGMNCSPTEDGFIVPLGPDLKASVRFFTA